MSITLALSAQVFLRRAAAALRLSPSAACIADLEIEQNGLQVSVTEIVLQPSNGRFAQDASGSVYFDLSLEMSARVAGTKLSFPGSALRLRIEGTSMESATTTIALKYEALTIGGFGPLGAENDALIEGAVATALSEGEFSVPLSDLLPSGSALTGDPEIVVAGQNPAGAGPTVVFGFGVTGDSGLDPSRFHAAFEDDPLEQIGRAWQLHVDKALMRANIAARIAATDVTETADDGVPHWLATLSTRAFWSGDPLSEPLFNQGPYISANFSDRPAWFFFVGLYETPLLVAVPAYLAGFGEFAIEPNGDNEPVINFVSEIYAVGSGIVSFPPDPAHAIGRSEVASAVMADKIIATEVRFDTTRWTLDGVDEHADLAAAPSLSMPTELTLQGEDSSKQHCLLPDPDAPTRSAVSAEAKAVFKIKNDGGSLLWICSLTIVGGEGSFSLETPSGLEWSELPSGEMVFALPPGDEVALQVTFSPDDFEKHTAELQVRSNDLNSAVGKIALRGQIKGGKSPCFELEVPTKARLFDPQEWFERFHVMTGSIGDWAKPNPEAREELEVVITGMRAAELVHLLDARGRDLGAAVQLAEGVQHVSIPMEKLGDVRLHSTARTRSFRAAVSISHMVSVGQCVLPEAPIAAAANDSIVAVAGRQGISILSLADPTSPKIAAAIEADGVGAITLRGADLSVQYTDDRIEFYSLDDPFEPALVHRMHAGEPGSRPTVSLTPKGLAIETRIWTRTYEMAPGSRPRLTHEEKLPRAPENARRDTMPPQSSAYMPDGRVSQARHVVEVAHDGKSYSVRVFEKAFGQRALDVAAAARSFYGPI